MASIKCGNCKQTHASVAEVKNCYSNKSLQVAIDPGQTSGVHIPKAPGPQIWEIADKLPKLRKMHYAIEMVPDVWHFYRVDKPTQGKWAGRTFLDVQAGDEYWPIKDPNKILVILAAIAKNPEKAASDYGHQIGRCGICRRTLTNQESIDRGIGPICAGKAGW